MFNSFPAEPSCEFNFNVEKGIVMSDFEDEKKNGYIAGVIDSRDIVNQKIIQLEHEKPLKSDEKTHRLEALREVSQELSAILYSE